MGVSALAQLILNAGGRIAAHGSTAAPAVENRGARKQQLQMIVEFGHGADGGARGAHRIGLIDGDRRRYTLDAIDEGLVHAIQELARVRREGFDIAALALRIQRVEDQRTLSRAADPGYNDQLIEGQVEVETLKIVLARATDADCIRAWRIEGWHSRSLQGIGNFSGPRIAPSSGRCRLGL